MRDLVLVFARAPRLGAIKRRLAREVGARAALRFYITTLSRLLCRLSNERRFALVLFLTPDRARLVLPGRLGRRLQIRPQGSGDLGARMTRAFRAFPYRRVALIGSDIPALVPSDLRAAFAALGSAEAAFGPAADGGYWLVALGPRRPAHPFASVRWSSPHALTDTLRNFQGRSIAFLRTLVDVDEAADLPAVSRALPSAAGARAPSPSRAASRSRCGASMAA